MTPESYHFGTRLAVRCDYYAFPRTGSHYLWACFTGLFDLVFYPNGFVEQPEARQRNDELNPHAYYVLRLRDDGVPYQPVYLNAEPQGTHGLPTPGDWPVIVLIRDPHPTIYSWFHTAQDRWGADIKDRVEWMKSAYQHYREFYERAFSVIEKAGDRALLLRFEALKESPAPLEQVVSFVGVQPKLAPKFVHWWTQFDRITQPGARTFYRSGNNTRWREDAAWLADLQRAAPGDFRAFGYGAAP
ncbi:MAG TPA: hypothetical protein VHD62_03875 [Opitutaceae bacterium]|nr:hypothetical protein [Opitutaceae bacterium]